MPKSQHNYTHSRRICWHKGTWHQAEEPGIVLGVFVSFVYCRPFPVLPAQTHWMFAVVAEPPAASFATAGTGRAAELPCLQAATLPWGWLLGVCKWQLSCSLRPVTATSPRARMCELERAEGPQNQKRKQREEYSIISLIRIFSWHAAMAPNYRIGFKYYFQTLLCNLFQKSTNTNANLLGHAAPGSRALSSSSRCCTDSIRPRLHIC